MKIIFILFVFACQFSFSQTEIIKVKKENSTPYITLGEIDTGFVLLTKLVENKNIIIHSEQKIKIYYFDAIVSNNGESTVFKCNNVLLPKKLISELKKNTVSKNQTKTAKLKLFNVVAFNDRKETVIVNDIELIMIK